MTSDGWTSIAIIKFVCLTLHYITKNFVYKKFVLSMKEMTDRCTAINLRLYFKEILQEWGLSELECYLTTDNDATMKAAIRGVENWNRIPCFCHTLQLCIKDAINEVEEFKNLIKKFSGIVASFKHSGDLTRKLLQKQEDLKVAHKPCRLIQCMKVRWNSEYLMINRGLLLKEPLSLLLAESDKYPENLSRAEWILMQNYKSVSFFLLQWLNIVLIV